jgi:hypothetical protein
METGVYTTVKRGSQGRALACSVGFLLFVLLLAASLSRSRGRERLAPRAQLSGWNLSIRPPKRFLPAEYISRAGGEAVSWYAILPHNGANAILSVRRFQAPNGADPASLCRDLIQGYRKRPTTSGSGALPPPSIVRLGPYEAVELFAPDRTAIVRLAFADHSIVVAVQLIVEDAHIDDSLYDLFNRSCKSIRTETD